jgi:hypothetical protein
VACGRGGGEPRNRHAERALLKILFLRSGGDRGISAARRCVVYDHDHDHDHDHGHGHGHDSSLPEG